MSKNNGLKTAYEVDVVPVDRAEQQLLERADLPPTATVSPDTGPLRGT